MKGISRDTFDTLVKGVLNYLLKLFCISIKTIFLMRMYSLVCIPSWALFFGTSTVCLLGLTQAEGCRYIYIKNITGGREKLFR